VTRAAEPRVVFCVLDGLPARHASLARTPNLFALAAEHDTRPAVIEGVMPSATYPNHATFVTGAEPRVHGLVANYLRDAAGELVCASAIGPKVPTVFDHCGEQDRTSALVVGDQELVGVTGGHAATEHWPPDGRIPDGAALDAHGFLTDDETVPHLVEACGGPVDFVIGQINGTDTAGHVHSPESEAALAAYAAADRHFGRLRDALAARWSDVVLLVVSDHSMVAASHDPVDPGVPARDRGLEYLPEGDAAVVHGDDPEDGRWLADVAGVAGSAPIGEGMQLLWAEDGRQFGFDGFACEPGCHGGPRTLDQVAVVGGGHPAARPLARRVAAGGFRATDWAPVILELLGLTSGAPTSTAP